MLKANYNVLLVEDNELQGGLLKEMLRSDSVLVTLVTSAEDAFVILKDRVFDLIISDVNLPMMSGHQLVKILKSGVFKKIPFFLYSSRAAEPDEIDLALRLGADKYIGKTSVQGIYEEVMSYIKSNI